MATPALTPWWKKRWLRAPLWAWAAGALIAAGVVDVLARHDGPATTGSAASTSSRADSATSTTAPRGEWTVISVTDGDTLDVHGPDGAATVRLIGINAPERGECGSEEATAALQRLVDRGPLTLARDQSDVDRFGRLLRYVENAKGVDVGGALVRAGDAISRRYPPDTPRNDGYDRLQDAARSAGRGQWAPDACGAAKPDASVAIDVHADAEGDDNLNLDDEWVRFTNTSTKPLDLTDWVVADESATHRYTFGSLVLAPGASTTLYTGCGRDGPSVRYWCNEDLAVWNNAGDTVFLRDPSGNNVAVLGY